MSFKYKSDPKKGKAARQAAMGGKVSSKSVGPGQVGYDIKRKGLASIAKRAAKAKERAEKKVADRHAETNPSDLFTAHKNLRDIGERINNHMKKGHFDNALDDASQMHRLLDDEGRGRRGDANVGMGRRMLSARGSGGEWRGAGHTVRMTLAHLHHIKHHDSAEEHQRDMAHNMATHLGAIHDTHTANNPKPVAPKPKRKSFLGRLGLRAEKVENPHLEKIQSIVMERRMLTRTIKGRMKPKRNEIQGQRTGVDAEHGQRQPRRNVQVDKAHPRVQ